MNSSIGLHLVRVCAAFLFVASAAVAEPGNGDNRLPRHVTSQACKACHEQQFRDWSGSHHEWAWRLPEPENVLGDFDDASFHPKGITTRFSNRDGRYYVETDGPGGRPREFEVKYTVGVEPLQQYLVETEPGRLQALDLAWDTIRKRWFHLYPDQNLPHGDGLHWTGPYKNWNSRCAECHATGYAKNYDPRSRTYSSTQAEIGVGCEACHGPGGAHVTWAKAAERSDRSRSNDATSKGLTVALAATEAEVEIQQCATCHARREPLGASSPIPGGAFGDHYRLALLRDGLYYPDGQILDEVYVYGSFLQSKMYARGVRCTNCHDPHGLGLVATENAICTRCHSPVGHPDFPTLKLANYDAPEHHHHRPGTSGALCVSCHMPAKNYMVIDARRDHSFRIPRPDLSTKLGTPNACADCHGDKTARWAARQVNQWFPDGRSGRPHYSEAFSSARRGDHSTMTRDKLVAVALDTQRPAIVRASALDLLRPASDRQTAAKVAPLLRDVSDIVRAATVRLFRSAPIDVRLRQVAPLTADQRRSVRIAAARELVSIPPHRISAEDQRKIAAAFGEFQQSLFAKSDFPETQMSIAGLALVLRNPRAANAALKTVISMDPKIADAWLLLSRVQTAQRKFENARQTLTRGIKHLPGMGLLHQALGNVLIQQGQDRQALTPLSKAAQLMPRDVAVHIDLAATLTRLNQHTEAARIIGSAQEFAPNDPDLLALKATNRLSRGLLAEARDIVRELVRRYPEYRLTQKLGALLNLAQ